MKGNILKKYIKFIYFFWANIYDTLIDKLFKFDRKKSIQALNIKKNEKIIEIGVGTGLNLPYYPYFCLVTGIDFSKEMLKKAKTKKFKAMVTFRKEDARHLSFKDNSFDKALSTYVLRVSPEPKIVLKEISRVVKNEGCFVIIDQFEGNYKIISSILSPLKLILGWGKEYSIKKLTDGTNWKIQSVKRSGIIKNTFLVKLRNKKLENKKIIFP